MDDQVRELKKRINVLRLLMSMLESLGDTPTAVQQRVVVLQQLTDLENSARLLQQLIDIGTTEPPAAGQSFTAMVQGTPSSTSAANVEMKTYVSEKDFDNWLLQTVVLKESEFLDELCVLLKTSAPVELADRMLSLRKQFISDQGIFGAQAAVMFLQIAIQEKVELSADQKLFILSTLEPLTETKRM
jgi:hypothetical protein